MEADVTKGNRNKDLVFKMGPEYLTAHGAIRIPHINIHHIRYRKTFLNGLAINYPLSLGSRESKYSLCVISDIIKGSFHRTQHRMHKGLLRETSGKHIFEG